MAFPLRLLLIFAACACCLAHAADGPAVETRNLSAGPSTRRIALVIGNDAYKHVPPLEKAANDARAMGKALEKVHFETRVVVNATRAQMNKAINQFADDVAGGGIGVFFFAGHGVQVNNQNFLIPVDLQDIQREADVADQGVSLQGMQDKLAEVRAKFSLLVIDACRDNPLPKKAGRALGGTRGLTQASSAEGQMVVFSAGANQQALDKLADNDLNPNGVFTRELLPWLNKPGVSIRDAVLGVRSAVRATAKSVNHEQFPAIYDQAEGNFYFIDGGTQVAQLGPGIGVKSRTREQIEDELWDAIKDGGKASVFEEYIKQYPKGRYLSQARIKLAGLKETTKPTLPAIPPAPTSAPLTAASAGAPFVLAKGFSADKLVPIGTYSLKVENTPLGMNPMVVGIANAVVDCGVAMIHIHVEDADGLNLTGGITSAKLTAGEKVRLSFGLGSSVTKDEFRRVVFDKIQCLSEMQDAQAAARPKAQEEFARGPQWAESDNGADINWADAKSYCASKGSGWRLPTTAELQSSYKAGQSTPCGSVTCQVTSKSSLTGHVFWSNELDSTPMFGSTMVYAVMLVSMTGHRMGAPSIMRNNYRALCVRDR